jgi:hypothetical protein
MLWLATWIAVSLIGVAGVVASTNSIRFARRVAHDVRKMWTQAVEPPPIDRRRLETLPPPVRHYLGKAIGDRGRAVRTARLRHGGTFRTKLDGGWLPIRGEQYFSADPPGFVWWGRVRVIPGLWVDARDRSVDAVANMLVKVESTFTLADSTGPELDESALQRLLGELVWFPTVLLDDRYVAWTAIDARQARATLRVNGREVVGVFELGQDDLPAAFSAPRYRDLGGGKAVLTPFVGEYGDYRWVDGLLVPHRVNGYWVVDGQRLPYVRFQVERLEYDVTPP